MKEKYKKNTNKAREKRKKEEEKNEYFGKRADADGRDRFFKFGIFSISNLLATELRDPFFKQLVISRSVTVPLFRQMCSAISTKAYRSFDKGVPLCRQKRTAISTKQ